MIDDYEVWRRFVASALEERPEFKIVGEAADGLEAVQRVQDLQPDLVLLDIGLPKLTDSKRRGEFVTVPKIRGSSSPVKTVPTRSLKKLCGTEMAT